MDNENTAKAYGRALPISTRQSVEICNLIRGKTTDESKKILQDSIDQKKAIPFKRYNKNVGHRKGKIGSGRFPKKASLHILELIKSVESNAKNIGLTIPLIIETIIANKGSRNWHYGRIRRIKTKRTHVEIVVKEKKDVKEKKEAKK